MGLETLQDDIGSVYSEFDDRSVTLDDETKTELAMLVAALDPETPDALVRRGIHLLFQQTVDTGKLDFHLRNDYGVTYDEYLSGMTYDEMAGGPGRGQDLDEGDRRYQF
ncbi:MAG: hypothetical protein ABEJ35_00055 [Halobacteriaceae archaeon]